VEAMIIALVVALRAKLETAAEVFHQKKDDAETEGKRLALCAVLDFLRALDGAGGVPSRAPFFKMLSDLDETPGKELMEVERLATVAGTVTVLKENCGMSVVDAINAVIKATGERPTDETRKHLRQSRKDVATGRVRGIELYQAFVDEAKASDLPIEEKKNLALAFVRALFQGK
jgi:hypothetical protein